MSLIAACYPSSSVLASSGPEYRPNAQELSKLTYYAANRPGKINKLGGELEKRVKAGCHKAQYGNARARAYVLGSLKSFLQIFIILNQILTYHTFCLARVGSRMST